MRRFSRPHCRPETRRAIFDIQRCECVVRGRIAARLEARLEIGLVEEVRGLLDRGITAEKLDQYGLEYRWVTRFVTGSISREEMVRQLQNGIFDFAKRQASWFRRMERRGVKINWIDARLPLEEQVRSVLDKWPA